jgi:DNA-binding NtrC family response regulator
MNSVVVMEVAEESSLRELEVVDGTATLIGRDPDPARLTRPAREASAEVSCVRIANGSVSANHLLVARGHGTTTLLDTHSRNGSWLQLPPGEPVTVAASAPLRVRLSSPPGGDHVGDGPADATWIRDADYPTGVANAISMWLAVREIPARVTVRRDGGSATLANTEGRDIPLVSGHVLSVMPTQTMDTRWNDVLAALWRYVNAQNAIYGVEAETRAEGLVLESPAIRQAHRQVVAAAQRGTRLLLIGPSGAGKDGLARCYHRYSRRSGLLVAKNCSMFSRELVRSELFGAEAGAFTGAVRRITGAVESANGGTLFLDELGELPIDVQPLLLSFLDRGEYERMGGSEQPRRSDVRLVCATNRDLRTMTLEGKFREDLWYRIAGQVVVVPPLRDRPEDVEAFLARPSTSAHPSVWNALHPEAQALVLAHPWLGNFRELAAFVAQLPVEAPARSISAHTCRGALASVALTRPAMPRPSTSPRSGQEVDPGHFARSALDCFRDDIGHGLQCWDDLKEYVERYLKPILFAEMTGASALASRRDAQIPALASAIAADRGTAQKHLNRYFERFKR